MSPTIVYAATAIALLLYLLGAWFLGSVLGLQGSDIWVLRGGLALIGLAAAGTFLWFYWKIRKQQQAPADAGTQKGTADADKIIQLAENQLRASKLGRNASLRNLPVVFLIGEAGAGKTSAMLHSGLEPELLAGYVYGDDKLLPVPTQSANVWYKKNTVFIEANAASVGETSRWPGLLRLIQPRRLDAFGRRHQPRAAVVCVSCETFLGANAVEGTVAAARRLRSALEEVARLLGSSFPVYVLFTNADHIPFFTAFAKNLTGDEAGSVLGATMPLRGDEDSAVYAQQQGERLNSAFKNLVLSLADKRRDLLAKEPEPAALGAVYEFPRELLKLRSALVQFLVDLCKPSQLRATPFIRGFYFSGVRPVIVTFDAPAPAAQQAEMPAGPLGATGVFRTQARPSQAPPQPKTVRSSRKVPQFTFLNRFFTDVLLRDTIPAAAAQSNVRTNTLRQLLLVSGAALCILVSILLTVSYLGNRALQNEVQERARALSANSASSPAALKDSLQKLESFRQTVEKLATYRRQGAPWRLRLGLYSGTKLEPAVRAIYFRNFQVVLFGETQQALVEYMRSLPPAPVAGTDYATAYDVLKGYLVTTSNHDKSTRAFLSPVLLKYWPARQTVDPEAVALAQKQFDFYSEELGAENPYSSENDTRIVERTRRYLSQFAGADRVYQIMLSDASRANSSIAFPGKYQDSVVTVVDNREVAGAYSKAGWAYMQDAIKNADRYFSGEQWVLGDSAVVNIERVKLEQDLKRLYTAGFINQWVQFLQAASIVRFGGIKDAAVKLDKLAANRSQLLGLLCLVSQNTAVDSPDVMKEFKPAQAVVPAACGEELLADANKPYITALGNLGLLLASLPPTPDPLKQEEALAAALKARAAVQELRQAFGTPVNGADAIVRKLLEDPILNAEAAIRGSASAEINAKGKQFCSQLSALTSKYPFNPTGKEAGIQDLNAIFQPQLGALPMLYESLKPNLEGVPGQLTAKKDSPLPINPGFLGFLNRALRVADAFYQDSPQPRLSFTLKPVRMENSESTLTLDEQTVTTTGGAASKPSIWTGNPKSQVRLTYNIGTEAEFGKREGSWALFRLLEDADRVTQTANGNAFEWVIRQGRTNQPVIVKGMPLTIRFDVEGKNAFVFQKSFLGNLGCVSEIAK